ncbi:efflux RND transporter periplasmic adaptor subunit [Nitrogeniibacter mangrovi]|uniref:Efflux RND transporter periplasmic adaptor subunit n=1 Tax=Nitrogeniibacter mangrovi TaxID=2016596 RepID=A0A6C1B687_9RHOO|nr:efflux RND transporter periplasmic adaptor subunit [Nitrogeniibacter mangrovi]QID18967.1 efflux RND transporter periplasmic adaptor subunit [Nitrogeniibacter mangrovi]
MRARTLVLLIVALGIGGAIWWLKRPEPIPVVLATVETGTVEATVSNTRAGEVEACRRAKLSTIAGGRIEYIGIAEGDKVTKGQVLMRLWNEDFAAQVTVAQRQLTTAQKRVAEACAMATNARREAARQKALQAKGFVSASAAQSAQAEAESRTATCQSARAAVAAAQAQVAAARATDDRTVLVAPFDGTVAKIEGKLGEYTTPSPPGVATPPAIDLIDETCLYVKAPMDEVDAPKITAGLPVRITLDAVPGRTWAGHVRRIAPYVQAVEKQARTVDVDVDFDDPAQARGLLVGYSADAEVVLAVRKDTLRIPTAALREGNSVLRYDAASGRLESRTVTPGIANWEYTEVTDGLAAGDRVVTSLEREGIEAGALVTPESPDAAK